MPNKSKTPSRTNSVTPAASENDSRKKDDDVESVDMIEETDDEGFDDESCDEAREMRVRFKVRGLLRVNTLAIFLIGSTTFLIRSIGCFCIAQKVEKMVLCVIGIFSTTIRKDCRL